MVRNMPLEAEAVEQRLLHHPPLAHHRPNLLRPGEGNQQQAPRSSRVFQRNSFEGGHSLANIDRLRGAVKRALASQWNDSYGARTPALPNASLVGPLPALLRRSTFAQRPTALDPKHAFRSQTLYERSAPDCVEKLGFSFRSQFSRPHRRVEKFWLGTQPATAPVSG